MQKWKAFFLAEIDKTIAITVHGVSANSNERRFFIKKVYDNAKKWKHFDEDVHSPGSAILWDINCTATISTAYGHDGNPPTKLEKPKRKQNESEWQKNTQKRRRLSGEQYEYKYKSGELRAKPARSIRKTCSSKCSKKCQDKFSEDERKIIHQDFWSLSDINVKRMYLSKLIDVKMKKRKRKRKTVKSGKRRERKLSRTYHFIKPNSGARMRICQAYFLSTLDISEKMIRTLVLKTSDSGAVEKDQRGFISSHNKLSDSRMKSVVDHISLFRTVDSHYVRKDSSCQYLPENLSVAEMHRMYTEWCTQNNFETESYDTYYMIFKQQFNLKFKKPKKDQCDTCTTFQNLPDDLLTDELVLNQNNHLNEKNLARENKNKMKLKALNDESVVAAVFDFQKTLLCPHGQTSSFYYTRRLKNYNFTITSLSSMKTVCFLWNECDGKKGACEVATCVLKYLMEAHSQGKKSVYLFRDKCVGQNNNRMVYVMLASALELYNFEEIELNFFVSGHSQNENDAAHSVIERSASKVPIYTTSQWETIILAAFKKNPPTVGCNTLTNLYTP